METTFQKIHKEYDSKLELARKYYIIILSLNGIKYTKSQLNLIAFSAVNGTISTPPIVEQFIKEFKIPKGSVYNMSAQLQKKGVFVKGEDNKIRVNPSICPDFSKGSLLLAIKMDNNA